MIRTSFLIFWLFCVPSVFADSNAAAHDTTFAQAPSPTLNALLEKLSDTPSAENLNAIFSGAGRNTGGIDVAFPRIERQPGVAIRIVSVPNSGVHANISVPFPERVEADTGAENTKASDMPKIIAAMALMGKTTVGAGMCRNAGASACDTESFGYANIKMVVTKGLEPLGQTSKKGRKITIELSDRLLSMSETQLAIVLGHELGHVEDVRTFSALSLPVLDADNPDPYMLLSEAKAQQNNIFLLKELEEKGLASEPLTVEERFERAGSRITLAVWESKNTGKQIGALSDFQTGNVDQDKQLEKHYGLCKEAARNNPNSLEAILNVGFYLGEERVRTQLHQSFPNASPAEHDEMFSKYINRDSFIKHYRDIARQMQRKDIAFIRQQYGREGKVLQDGYDFNREPIYIKKANVGLGLWDACHTAPKIQPLTVMQIKNFGVSLDEIYVSELENGFSQNSCQKKLLNHIRLNVGFNGVTADWLNYAVSHNFTNPPSTQHPPSGGGGGQGGNGGTGQPFNPHPQFPPGTWPQAGQKLVE